MKMPLHTPDSIGDSDASAASSGGKWELMHYVHYVSSHLPTLDAADASESPVTGMNNYFFYLGIQ